MGSLSIPLAKLGATVASSDISEAMTTEATERAKVGVGGGGEGFFGYVKLESRIDIEVNPLDICYWI